jgi:ABC-type antimicrobial peptide transport system permease subunit
MSSFVNLPHLHPEEDDIIFDKKSIPKKKFLNTEIKTKIYIVLILTIFISFFQFVAYLMKENYVIAFIFSIIIGLIASMNFYSFRKWKGY